MVWKINGENRDATYAAIMTEWNRSLEPGRNPLKNAYLRRLAKDIMALPDKCLEQYDAFVDEKSFVAFHLSESIVTLPETACIFMELLAFPPDHKKPHRIDKNEFAAHVKKQYGIRPRQTLSTLQSGLNAGYVTELPTGDIWITARIQREREYLRLLVAEYKNNHG